MPSSPLSTGQARFSCQRCHRRKKRCDRTLPQCENCRLAHVSCSFLDDDRQVGSYSVAFVRGLEAKVRALEHELASASGASRAATNDQAESPNGTSNNAEYAGPLPLDLEAAPWVDIDTDPFIDVDVRLSDVVPGVGASPHRATPGSLVEGLKLLSLEAAAERYLGSTSGVSFARLTQMVLQRLSPDRAEFVFRGRHEEEEVRQDQPLIPDALNSIMNNFKNSLTAYPTLFGDFSLSDIFEPPDVLASLELPEEAHLQHLVEFYFAHSHTLYPIINQLEFTAALRQIHQNPQDQLARSPLWLFRIWIVLAIGATAHCSVSLMEESEPMLYYNKAMQYFELALGYGDMAALEVITLQVSYSFFNQLGPNTWFLVGLAARMAVGMGLHAACTYDSMPPDLAERRKRVFFSIYMMDRVVSMALGRPFALHDDDIDVTPFMDVDITPDGILRPPRNSLQPSTMAIPLHILSLRRLASKIAKQVYSKTPQVGDRDEVTRCLHNELIEWRRSVPFPLPDIHPSVPHSSTSWYDFNFYTHLAMLYRPSPLFPTLDQSRVKILADAAAMSIRQAINMHRQKRFAYNWLNLLSVFTAALSLIYAVTAQPDNLVSVLKETGAVGDLNLVLELFGTLSIKYPTVEKIRTMLQEVVTRYNELCSGV
ncbi:Zn(2)-C6 fungal-type DNA-binding domain [Pleurostoma richardsiae]|uniref:Zn(2)-C6 fungal-type DNA-binding domain n=1 Tax=Pleurostoma richardsiae TaxID=41990 RepID=A0AA38VIC3_9PEZI|nr:Zn(2)-C6 fungal-type DNA-binding domain [Pleurostoma richardsiae]